MISLNELMGITSIYLSFVSASGCKDCLCCMTRNELEESKANGGYGLKAEDLCPCQHPVSSHRKQSGMTIFNTFTRDEPHTDGIADRSIEYMSRRLLSVS